jgi:hypothetical protein
LFGGRGGGWLRSSTRESGSEANTDSPAASAGAGRADLAGGSSFSSESMSWMRRVFNQSSENDRLQFVRNKCLIIQPRSTFHPDVISTLKLVMRIPVTELIQRLLKTDKDQVDDHRKETIDMKKRSKSEDGASLQTLLRTQMPMNWTQKKDEVQELQEELLLQMPSQSATELQQMLLLTTSPSHQTELHFHSHSGLVNEIENVN